jgi:formylmethanofuran dehydrogenase subunit E
MNDIYVARSSAIAARALEEEMVIMSMRDSTLFTLNEVAAEIWRAADGKTPLSEIVRNNICAKFATDPDAAYADAEIFCRQLSDCGILMLSDRPIELGG